MFAYAEDVITTNAVAPTKTFELREYTDRFRSVSYAIRLDFGKKKIAFSQVFRCAHDCCCRSRLAKAAGCSYDLSMTRGVAFLLVVGTTLFAQDPNKNDPDSFDIEPPLLIPNRHDEDLARAGQAAPANVDLAQLEKEVERAKRSAAGVERLYKMGALSKLEAEQRALRVVRLEFDLANARLTSAKEAMLEKDKQATAGQIRKVDATQTETNLALAIEAAHVATAKRDQAEIDAAEANVRRQEKLLALGSARRKDVERAVQKLAELKAAKN